MDNQGSPADAAESIDDATGDHSRRKVLAAAGGTALTAALAGCGALFGGDDGGDGGDGGTGGGGQPSVPDEPIEAGMQVFLEGVAAVFGVPTRNGAQLAVDRINEAGGIAGREINLEVIHEDDVVSNYESFVDQGKDVTFGPISSGSYESLAPEVEEQGIINVCPAGTTTTIFEEIVTDPTYNFRTANYAPMDSATAAIDALERWDDVDTIAGINPNYTGGRNAWSIFSTAIQQLTDVEVVYEGWPDLATDDYSTHLAEVNNLEPDITYSIVWGGDAVTFLNQADANNLFDNTNVIGNYFYGQLNELSDDVVGGSDVVSGSRQFYWGHPSLDRYEPMQDLLDAARDRNDAYPSFPFHEGYMAVTAWATAAEKAVNVLGGWPSQEQLAAAMEQHGYYTPAGYHSIRPQDHQAMNSQYFGRMATESGRDVPVMEDINVYSASEIAPPPGATTMDWIESWG
mgnify:CR=1 FL=1